MERFNISHKFAFGFASRFDNTRIECTGLLGEHVQRNDINLTCREMLNSSKSSSSSVQLVEAQRSKNRASLTFSHFSSTNSSKDFVPFSLDRSKPVRRQNQ